jgi:hypothetical protein
MSEKIRVEFADDPEYGAAEAAATLRLFGRYPMPCRERS